MKRTRAEAIAGVVGDSCWKIATWNVNGLRACLKKQGLQHFLAQVQPHLVCLSETKCKEADGVAALAQSGVLAAEPQEEEAEKNGQQTLLGMFGKKEAKTSGKRGKKGGKGKSKKDAEEEDSQEDDAEETVVENTARNASENSSSVREDGKESSSFLYKALWNSGNVKKGGYAGTALLIRDDVQFNVDSYSVGFKDLDDPDSEEYEGRIQKIDFDDFILVNTYVPNSGQKLERLDFRTETWEVTFQKYLKELSQTKPLIWTGDLNVAHLDIDIHDPKSNKNKSAGFTDAERARFGEFIADGEFVDFYRHLYPEEKETCYTYFSHRFQARQKNKGWRIDYFVGSKTLIDRLGDVQSLKDYEGSDHCPLLLTLSKSKSSSA